MIGADLVDLAVAEDDDVRVWVARGELGEEEGEEELPSLRTVSGRPSSKQAKLKAWYDRVVAGDERKGADTVELGRTGKGKRDIRRTSLLGGIVYRS